MNRHAVLIGINKYRHDGIVPLEYAVADALGMRSVLLSSGTLSIPRGNMAVLTDGDTTRRAILAAVQDLAERCSPDDTAIFFYAGHGYSEFHGRGNKKELRKYLVPCDANPDDMASTAIDFDELSEALRAVKSTHFLMMFDCCYSGALGGRTFQTGTRAMPYSVDTKYLEMISGIGRLVMTACTGQEVAREDKRLKHGVFSSAVIDALSGDADYKKDGLVDSEELWMFVQANTLDRSHNKQHPVRTGYVEGQAIYLADPQPTQTTAADRETMAARITHRFGLQRLQKVFLAPSASLADIGSCGAEYLRKQMRENMRLAVSCGHTLVEVITRMERLELGHVEVFPMSGSPSEEICLTDSMMLSCLLLSRFCANDTKPRILPMGIPETYLERSALEKELRTRAASLFALAKESDIYLCGIGNLGALNDNHHSILDKAGISRGDLERWNAVGEISYHFYDDSGSFIALRKDLSASDAKKLDHYSRTFYSLGADVINDVFHRRGIETVIVAAGETKRNALLAAIRGGLIRTLITDVSTGKWLLDYEGEDVKQDKYGVRGRPCR